MAAEKTPRKTTTPNSGTSWSSSAKAKAYITVQGHLLAVDGSVIPSQRVRLVQPGLRAPRSLQKRATMCRPGQSVFRTHIVDRSHRSGFYQSGKTAQEKAIEINDLNKDAIVNK
jgi:hypothetical protein